ncbi:MAG: hypothetical protein ACRCSK_02215 [Fusobacteriaceae bacterium]
MKKIFLLALVFISINLASFSMSKKEFKSDLKIQNAFEKDSEKKFHIEANKISNIYFEMNFTFLKDRIIINVKNISNQAISIDWNKTRYVGLDEYDMRLYNFSQKDKGEFFSMMDSFIRPKKDVTVEVLPIRNMKFVGERISVIEKNLFDEQSIEVKNKKLDFAKIIIPVKIGDSQKKLIINSHITFGK